MMGGSTEEFYTTSDGQGRIDLPSPRRDVAGASPAPPQLYHGRRALRPLKLQWLFHHGRQRHSQTPTSPSIDGKHVRTENEHKPMLSHLASSRRQHNDGMSSPLDKRQLRWAMRATVVRAPARGEEDFDDGLRIRPRSIQGSDFHPQLWV
jgi:hypothetical protein